MEAFSVLATLFFTCCGCTLFGCCIYARRQRVVEELLPSAPLPSAPPGGLYATLLSIDEEPTPLKEES